MSSLFKPLSDVDLLCNTGKYGDLKSSQGLASLVEAHSDANPAVMNQCEPAQVKVIYICIGCNI